MLLSSFAAGAFTISIFEEFDGTDGSSGDSGRDDDVVDADADDVPALTYLKLDGRTGMDIVEVPRPIEFKLFCDLPALPKVEMLLLTLAYNGSSFVSPLSKAWILS